MARALKKGSDGGWKRRLLAIGGLLIVGLAAGATGGAMGAWQTVCYDCPSVAQLYNWEPRQSTKILSHDGIVPGRAGLERRTPVDIDSLPPHVRQAFVAIEDKRFYRHQGYDIVGYARAIRNQLMGGSPGAGARSRSSWRATCSSRRSASISRFRRKLKELHVAVDLERVYSKDQILEAYINQINYDQGWYGIESAAQNYFGKHAPELNPAEAAMLAAVINRPAHYNPLKHPERALQRRNLVLGSWRPGLPHPGRGRALAAGAAAGVAGEPGRRGRDRALLRGMGPPYPGGPVRLATSTAGLPGLHHAGRGDAAAGPGGHGAGLGPGRGSPGLPPPATAPGPRQRPAGTTGPYLQGHVRRHGPLHGRGQGAHRRP
jgi:hypothetical protein